METRGRSKLRKASGSAVRRSSWTPAATMRSSSRDARQPSDIETTQNLRNSSEHVKDALISLARNIDANDKSASYKLQRFELVEHEQSVSWYAKAESAASPAELEANRIVMKIREHERRDPDLFGNLASEPVPDARSRDVGGRFLKNRDRIENSKIFSISHAMPKGAHQHLHFNSEIPPEVLFPHARSREMQDTMFIRSTLPLTSSEAFWDCEIVFSVFPKETTSADIFSPSYDPNVKDTNNCPWMLWRKFRNAFPAEIAPSGPGKLDAPERWAREKMIITVDQAYGEGQTHNGIWACFNQCTRAFKGLLGYEGVYRWYIGHAIDSMIQDKVMYAELRPMLLDKSIPPNDGLRKIGLKEQMSIICEEVIKKRRELEARNELDKFPFSLKIIYCTPRSIPLARMRTELEDCIALKVQFPDLICGFDLVGAEDRPNNVRFYADLLLAFQQTCKELRIEIPFMFHAGETLIDTGGSSDPENSNLYDALLLHAKRIGHGYALLKHPQLVEKYKQKNICLELCPISNELLHLCGNAREHPCPQLLAAGLHCTLNADNPSLFRYVYQLSFPAIQHAAGSAY